MCLSSPVPAEMEASVAAWARALAVEERSLVYLRDLARGEVAKAVQDFYRLNWIGDLDRCARSIRTARCASHRPPEHGRERPVQLATR